MTVQNLANGRVESSKIRSNRRKSAEVGSDWEVFDIEVWFYAYRYVYFVLSMNCCSQVMRTELVLDCGYYGLSPEQAAYSSTISINVISNNRASEVSYATEGPLVSLGSNSRKSEGDGHAKT